MITSASEARGLLSSTRSPITNQQYGPTAYPPPPPDNKPDNDQLSELVAFITTKPGLSQEQISKLLAFNNSEEDYQQSLIKRSIANICQQPIKLPACYYSLAESLKKSTH
jgi:hypothetical protein